MKYSIRQCRLDNFVWNPIPLKLHSYQCEQRRRPLSRERRDGLRVSVLRHGLITWRRAGYMAGLQWPDPVLTHCSGEHLTMNNRHGSPIISFKTRTKHNVHDTARFRYCSAVLLTLHTFPSSQIKNNKIFQFAYNYCINRLLQSKIIVAKSNTVVTWILFSLAFHVHTSSEHLVGWRHGCSDSN